MPVEAAMEGKRRRLHDAAAGHPVSPPSKRRRDGGDHDSRASKKQADGRASFASAVAQLSCARIRPYVRASRPKEEKTEVSAGDNAQVVIKKQNADNRISCIGGNRAAVQAPRPTEASTQVSAGDKAQVVIKKQNADKRISCMAGNREAVQAPRPTEPSSQVRARAVADDVKQKAGQGTSCTRTRPAVQASRLNGEIKFISSGIGVLGNGAHGVTKNEKQQESGERVQAIATASIPQLARPAPPSIPKDPFDADNEFRAALVAARQAIVRRQREAARRERDKVVQTVYFNDPNMTLENLLKAQALIGSC